MLPKILSFGTRICKVLQIAADNLGERIPPYTSTVQGHMRNIAAGTYSRRQSLTDSVESFVLCIWCRAFIFFLHTCIPNERFRGSSTCLTIWRRRSSTNAPDNSYNKHEPTAKEGIRTRACHRKHYAYYMCLLFRSSSYPCKDSTMRTFK